MQIKQNVINICILCIITVVVTIISTELKGVATFASQLYSYISSHVHTHVCICLITEQCESTNQSSMHA